jgi:hypothetical protein
LSYIISLGIKIKSNSSQKTNRRTIILTVNDAESGPVITPLALIVKLDATARLRIKLIAEIYNLTTLNIKEGISKYSAK